MTVIEYLAQYDLLIKDFIPCLSAFVAGGLTVTLVVLNNKKMIAGQVETQKELFKHQTEQLQKQLEHDLEKHKSQMDLDRKELYFNIKNTNSHMIYKTELERVKQIEISLSNYMLASQYSDTYIIDYIFKVNSFPSDLSEDYMKEAHRLNNNTSNALIELSYQFSMRNEEEFEIIKYINNIIDLLPIFINTFIREDSNIPKVKNIKSHEIQKSESYLNYTKGKKKLREAIKVYIDRKINSVKDDMHTSQKEIKDWIDN